MFEWHTLAAQTAAEHPDPQGISSQFSREVIEAATHVNYGQVCGLIVVQVLSSPSGCVYRR